MPVNGHLQRTLRDVASMLSGIYQLNDTPPSKLRTHLSTVFIRKVTFLFFGFLIASMVVVIIGLILISGNTEIYCFRKIFLAPIVFLSGFSMGFFAVLKKPAKSE